MKKILIASGVLCILLLTSIFLFNSLRKKTELQKNHEDSSGYLLGQAQAHKLEYLELKEDEIKDFLKGFEDYTFKGKKTIDASFMRLRVQRFIEDRIANNAKRTQEEGTRYAESFLSKGGKKTDSGLLYKIDTPGNSKRVQADGTVEVDFHGTLPDGRIFDSSLQDGAPRVLNVDRLIKGLAEGLTLIGEDGKVDLVIPSDLAYGDQ